VKAIAALQQDQLLEDLESQGVEVRAVDTLDAGVAALEEVQPDFAVIDESLGFAHELVISIRSDYDGPERDRLPVLLLAGAATNGGDSGRVACAPDSRLEAAGAADVVKAAKAIIMRRARQRRLFDQELILELPTTPEAVERLGDVFDHLVAVAGFPEEEQVRLGHTFREAVGNAAEHGNKNDAARAIRVNYLRSSDRIAVTVKDEGDGFDTDSFLSRAEQVSALEHTRSRRDSEARPGGLGVFIMKQTCDRIAFNGQGNLIFLMKFLPGAEER